MDADAGAGRELSGAGTDAAARDVANVVNVIQRILAFSIPTYLRAPAERGGDRPCMSRAPHLRVCRLMCVTVLTVLRSAVCWTVRVFFFANEGDSSATALSRWMMLPLEFVT